MSIKMADLETSYGSVSQDKTEEPKGKSVRYCLMADGTEKTTMSSTGGLPRKLVRMSLSLLAMFHFENQRLCLKCSREASGRDMCELPSTTTSDNHSERYSSVNEQGTVDLQKCFICEDMRPKTRLLYSRDTKIVRKVICYTIGGILTLLFVLQPLQKVYFRWANQSKILYLFYYLAFFMPPLLIAVCRGYAIFSSSKVTTPSIDTSAFCALTNDFIHGLLNRTNDKFVPLKRSLLIRGVIYNLCVLKFIGLYAGFQVSIFRAHCPEISGWGVFGCIVDMMGVLVFTEFWYVIYLLRLAVQLEFKSICVTLTSTMPTGSQHYDQIPAGLRGEENAIKDGDPGRDVIRRRIMESFLDFTRLNNLITHFLTVTMSVTIFKCSCHLYWNFRVFHYYTETFRIPALLINLTVWDSILMFLIIPVVSVGSINITYVWDEFLNCLDYELGCGKRWIVKFVEKKKCGSNSSAEMAMVALTGISIFVAFSFPVEQYGKYWFEDSICLYNNTYVPV
ncbi:uncharacterized protein [Ptychodera flava]|uniref:uncharacterized protein n=1 Tax=Ptychodera flava TaxID=63121 RepID=UPI00396A875C